MSVSLSPCLFSIWSSKIIYNSFFYSQPLTSSVSHIDTALDISILLSEIGAEIEIATTEQEEISTEKKNLVTVAVGHAYKKDAQPQFLLLFNSPSFFFVFFVIRKAALLSQVSKWSMRRSPLCYR